MDINPAVKAYTNLKIDDGETPKPKKSNMGMGLLSRDKEPTRVTSGGNEPKDRVQGYVSNIRKARKNLTNG